MDSKMLATDPDVTAPDGADVRVLCQTARGSMAHFTLAPGAVSRAVAHRTIDEVWYFLSGEGRMWRKDATTEETTAVSAGLSLTIPVGTSFQFRNDGAAPLVAVAVAMPPWPDMSEAFPVDGPWQATL